MSTCNDQSRSDDTFVAAGVNPPFIAQCEYWSAVGTTFFGSKWVVPTALQPPRYTNDGGLTPAATIAPSLSDYIFESLKFVQLIWRFRFS